MFYPFATYEEHFKSKNGEQKYFQKTMTSLNTINGFNEQINTYIILSCGVEIYVFFFYFLNQYN